VGFFVWRIVWLRSRKEKSKKNFKNFSSFIEMRFLMSYNRKK